MLPLAESVAARFALFPQVSAIALGGSEGAGEADALSDIDLYIYAGTEIPADRRRAIACDFADRLEVDNRFWEPGDEWVERGSGRGIDIMYRSPEWIEDQLARVLVRHEASIGYSTCFWWNVLHSRALYDPRDWYAGLQQAARQPYPVELQRAIVARNLPILRNNISSYRRQIETALRRGDRVSVNHRVTAFLASYWDIVFAVNAVPHPGEKRTVEHARRLCKKLPRGWEAALEGLLAAPSLVQLDELADGLEEML
jgi:predicted nucleotidyltransferase